ncbi:MAG TPA: alkaline phosphatase family protein [Geobacterales bacterium]|nr:alkaline phosphatase family protein [Geobacterales bacterium]
MNKLIYIILDGASDGIEFSMTSFDVANKPNLDTIAKSAKGGLVYPIEKGIAPESDAATLSMLGYNPKEIKAARGVLEALGAGLDFEDGDLALRGNFATIQGSEVIDRRAGRDLTDEEAKMLVEEIKNSLSSVKGHRYELKHTIGHRCVLLIKKTNAPLSSRITNLDPAYVRIGDVVHALAEPKKQLEPVMPLDDDAREAADLVNAFFSESRAILERSPINARRKSLGKLVANAILLRDAGSNFPKVQSFKERFGLEPICIADMPVELGIAKLLGMGYIWSRGLSYEEKANLAIESLANHSFVFVHIKGADERGHDGDFEGKVKAIEIIDRDFFGTLLKKVSLEKVSILVTCDHSTPPKLKAHSDSPVPFIFYKHNMKSDGFNKFSERECSKGMFGILEHGYLLLEKVLKVT